MTTRLRWFALAACLGTAVVATAGCGQETTVPGAGAPTVTEEPAETEEPTDDAPAWSAQGRLVGVYDDLAVVHDGDPGDSQGQLVALDELGSTVWERDLSEPPEALVGAPDLAVMVLDGHRNPRLVWSGTGEGTTVAAASVLDPATGEELADGSVDVPAGYAVSERLSGDQLWLAHATGVNHLLTVAEDGSMTVDDGTDGYDVPADSRAVSHDLLVDTVDGVVAVHGSEGPVAGPVDCISVLPQGQAPEMSGALPLSPDRDLVWVGFATVDLVDGSATCVAAPSDLEGGFTAVSDDGTLAGVDADGSLVILKDGTPERMDVPAPGHPEGFLGDLLVISTDDGLAAYPLD